MVYDLACADIDDPPGPADLARRLLGVDAIRYVEPHKSRSRVAFVGEPGRVLLLVQRGLTCEAETFALAWALASWALWSARHDPRDTSERLVAACIIAPRAAFLAVALALDGDLPALARAFIATESMIALRIGETRGTPVALVTPQHVRTRGGATAWPHDDAIRTLAKCGGPGLRAVRLHDDEQRTALFRGAV